MTDDITQVCTLTLDAEQFKKELGGVDRIARGFSRSLSDAFVGIAVKGKSLGDVVQGIGLRLSSMALSAAFSPIESKIGEFFSPFTKGLFGGTFNGGAGAPMNILPFAKGGVVSTPTYFPMAGGLGLTGERGAEAILPLARGADGRLGVKTDGGSAGSITINISTPDVEGFRRSQAEISASLARMVARGKRSL